ncbi:ABC transporter ATP-binding protein [Dyella flagellata]|uniref:ABC transporter ATP-binding protein n=1 Tax=Dyella flagellata TaxID=1867833 RepID=A0ABQ5X9L8_9GAMM|nr:ABC transporter ATP-binding protein [Dyella flagellata]GLQ87939.1 ABC transporter ATP-binding protein [Dyella flagellata]
MNQARAATEQETKSLFTLARSSLPLVWELVRPRRYRLLLGLAMLLVSRAAGLVIPYAPKLVIDTVIGEHQYYLLRPLFAVLIAAVLLQGMTNYALNQLLSIEGRRLITDMRCRVQAHISKLPVAFFDTTKTGMLVSRVMTDVNGIQNLVGQGLIELLGGLITAAFVLIILFHISLPLTLITLGFLAALCGFLGVCFKLIRPLFRESGRIASEVTGRLVESFSGIRLVKGYRAETREQRVFAAGANRLQENAIKTVTLGSVMGTVAIMDVRFMSAVVLCVGAQQAIAHHITAGSLFSYLMYLAIVVAPITQMASFGTQLAEALAGLDRTREILSVQPEDQAPERTASMASVQGHIQFRDVTFEYEQDKPVLHGVTFEAKPGTVTALVGPSGSGKSTITALISAFYKPSRGKVLVDGVDLDTVRLSSYRPSLGIVPQESFLFDGTIRENVAFSTRNRSEEAFLHACHLAHVDEFADHLENKYETTIGERGVRLSGGQRQRISIARAILAAPKILILDEATSNLDSESEAFIQDSLRHLMKDRTTFVIAHRLSTARQADQILVVEAGRIVEHGTHASLYAQKGRYFDLYSKQHDVEANTFKGIEEEQLSTRGRKRGQRLADQSNDGDLRALDELL